MAEVTPERLSEIEARAGAATPGPWESGVSYLRYGVNDGTHTEWRVPAGIAPGACAYCCRGEAVNVETDERGQTWHVHRCEIPRPDGWRAIASVSGLMIAGNYDSAAGGICSTKADSAFIAAARSDVPDLCAVIRAQDQKIAYLRGLLREARGRLRPAEPSVGATNPRTVQTQVLMWTGAGEGSSGFALVRVPTDTLEQRIDAEIGEAQTVEEESEEGSVSQVSTLTAERGRDALAAEAADLHSWLDRMLSGLPAEPSGAMCYIAMAILSPEELARLREALSRPLPTWAAVAAARQKVCEAAKRWLARSREAKAKDDVGQDDWYCAYAEDAQALTEALDALTAAERE